MSKQQIWEKIKEYETIIIHRHTSPDPDAIGSQGGLQVLIQEAFPEKNVYAVGEEVENLTFLHSMDTIEDSVYENALVIVLDTANTERISDQRYNQGATLIKIDHHPNRESYGDIQWVDTSFSSTSEMLTDFYLTFSETLNLSNVSARLLYAGIIGDTGRFLHNNTSAQTHFFASLLLETGIDPQEFFHHFYRTTKETARLQGYILQHFAVTKNGVAFISLTKELMNEFGVNKADAANLVNTLANIEGNHIWAFFVEDEGEIRVRIRSKVKAINTVANQFGGGGHPLASGATVKTKEDKTRLLASLDDLLM